MTDTDLVAPTSAPDPLQESQQQSPLAKFLLGQGRASRSTWLGGIVLFWVGAFVLALPAEAMSQEAADVFIPLVFLCCSWPLLALGVRRLHDLGKSGWHLLLGLVPIVGFALGLYMLFSKGESTPNRYGSPS